MAKPRRNRNTDSGQSGQEIPTIPKDRLLKIQDVAALASMSVSSARRRIRDGTLPPHVPGLGSIRRYHPLLVRRALGLDDLPEDSS